MIEPPMPPDFRTQRNLFRPSAAFSLIEVAMSLAIVTFSLVGILGMVPIGLSGFREAMDTTIGAQIAQRVVTDAEQSDFDTLIASAATSDANFFSLPVRYFDDQGSEVSLADPQAAAKIIYHARARGSQPGPADTSAGGGGFTSLPGAPRFHPRDTAFLTVQVAWHPGLAALPVDEARQLWAGRSAPMSTYRVVITRNGTAPKTTARQ
ncbi:MAG: Verru_Chthon cassette protein B [Chthoniobacteraceae bacterium]